MFGGVAVVVMVVVMVMWGRIAVVVVVSGDGHGSRAELVVWEMVIGGGGTVGGRRESGVGRWIGRHGCQLMGVDRHPGVV